MDILNFAKFPKEVFEVVFLCLLMDTSDKNNPALHSCSHILENKREKAEQTQTTTPTTTTKKKKKLMMKYQRDI